MKTAQRVLILALAVSAGADAQLYRRHFLTVGGGAGLPGGEVAGVLDNSPVFRFAYGYRFHPNFQIDAGLDTVFFAANTRDFFESDFGPLRIRDYQYLVPIGGRAVIPFLRDRLLISAGGGGAYFRYQESIRQPFGDNFRLDCPVCAARSGFGYYGLLGMSVALDSAQMFRIGFSSRVYRANVGGDAFGSVPGVTTRDRWVNTTAEFTLSF